MEDCVNQICVKYSKRVNQKSERVYKVVFLFTIIMVASNLHSFFVGDRHYIGFLLFSLTFILVSVIRITVMDDIEYLISESEAIKNNADSLTRDYRVFVCVDIVYKYMLYVFVVYGLYELFVLKDDMLWHDDSTLAVKIPFIIISVALVLICISITNRNK